MSKTAAKPTPDAKLAELRARIDAVDDKLIALILERTGIIREVAQLKADSWPNDCHIRSGREGKMHTRIARAFIGSIFSPKAAVALWRLLIGTSTNLESPLRIAFLASQPDYYWLAREYFGPAINLTSVAAPALVEESNILLLPAPDISGAGWWRHPLLHKGQPLRIFARLPLAEEELPGEMPPAVALAAITPEPSGDDISYLLAKTKDSQPPAFEGARVISNGTDHLLVISGFVTEQDEILKTLRERLGESLLTLHWLGSHPRPLKL
jgi:chorismate mutase